MTLKDEALARELKRPARVAAAVPAEQRNPPLSPPRRGEEFAELDKWYAKKMEEVEVKRAEKEAKTFLTMPTRAEVFGAIQGVVRGIQDRFASREDVGKVVGGVIRDLNQRQYVTKEEAKKIARDAVPSTLRGLDASGDKRTGNTLLLAVGGASGTDSAYWGQLAAGGGVDFSKVALGFTKSGTTITILAGEIDRIAVGSAALVVANNGIIYVRRTIADNTMLVATAASVPANDATYGYYRLYQFSVTGTAPNEVATLKMAFRPFDIDGIKIPFGTAGSPHLIWSAAAGAWGIGLVVPSGTAETPHLIWNAGTSAWTAGLIESDCLPEGGIQYQVLQRNGSGDAVWDWTRWAIV